MTIWHGLRHLKFNAFFKEIWINRRLCLDLIKRDIRFKFLGSVIGRYWNFIHPMAMIAIYTLVFSKIMGAKLGGLAEENTLSYTIYLCAGLLPWNAFIETINRGTNAYFDHGHLIKKVSFPSSVIHLVSPGAATFTFAISFAIYLVLLLISDFGITSLILLVPVIFLLQMAFAIGLAVFFSVLQVFFRDTAQVVMIVVQLWFWGTPIVYTADRIPPSISWLVDLNPMFHFINLYQQVIVFKTLPSAIDFLPAIILALVALLLGASFLGFFEKEIPDEI